MTVQDLIQAAMRSANLYASGDDPVNSDELADALFSLNQMLDSWSAERLLIYSIQRTLLTLPVNSSGSWQIGPGAADFPNVARPMKIEQAGLILPEVNVSPIEIPLRILTQQEWANVRVKYVPTPVPTAIYCDYGAPFATIYTYPLLNTGGAMALYAWQPLTAFAALTDTVQLPPGYSEALQYSLAVRLAAGYDKNPNPITVQLAIELKDRLKAANPEIYLAECDGFSSDEYGYGFNIYDGNYS
jgi:hypothetical protein